MSHEPPRPAIGVAIPGYRTLHIGPFTHERIRDDWQSSLRSQMPNTAHVPGATVEPSDYIPQSPDLVYLNPTSFTSDAETIADYLRHENDFTDPSANFPDTFTLLVAAFGRIKATRLYRQASQLIGDELELKALPAQQKASANNLLNALAAAQAAVESADHHLTDIINRHRDAECDMDNTDATDARHQLAVMAAGARALLRIIVPYRDALTS